MVTACGRLLKLVFIAFVTDRHHIDIIQNKCSDINKNLMQIQIFVWWICANPMHKTGGYMGDSKEETKNNRFTKRIGATTYVVNVHFTEEEEVL